MAAGGAPELFGPEDQAGPHAQAPHSDLTGQLLNAVSGARWFAGKGRRAELTGLTRLPWLTEVSQWPAVRFEVVEISYPADEDRGGEEDEEARRPYELYSVPLSYWPAPRPGLQHAELARCTDPDLGFVVAYDAAQDPAACRLLLEKLIDAARVRDTDTDVQFQLTAPEGLSADLEPRTFTGQQSNTSVMYGDVAMIKLFRRLELGHNLDIEVHDALNRAGIPDVAKLFGWVDAGWRHRGEDVRADLAMAVERLVAAEDGWDLALDALRTGRSFVAEAARLGVALAEIHSALRAAFPTGRHTGAGTAAVMTERLRAAQQVAPALARHADDIEACFGWLGHEELDTQRVHGDFHLGQTLRTPDGWKIIDFEGEPVKTLAERRRPDSVWRDVAGMLRSFDYAGASVPGPHSAGWVADCRGAFLQAYAGGEPSPDDAAILRAYEVDKAVYEVVYEVRNRPDWVHIPLAAVASLSGSPSVSDPTTHADVKE